MVASLAGVVAVGAGAATAAVDQPGVQRQFGPFPIVSGSLVGAGGAPIVGRVWLFMTVPSMGATTLQDPLLGYAKSDANGQFVVSTAKPFFAPLGHLDQVAKAAMSDIKRNGGWANLDLIATDGKVLLFRSIARQIAQRKTPGFVGPDGSVNVGALGLVPHAPGSTLVPPRNTAGAAASSLPIPVCVETVRTLSERKAPTVVGEIQAAGDSQETFTYGRQASSDIEVGLRASDGQVSVAGETHIGNSEGAAERWGSDTDNNKKLLAYFTYREEEHQTFGACPSSTFKTVSAIAWDFGEAVRSGVSDPSIGCTKPPWSTRWRDPYPPGREHGFTRTEGRAVSYTGAADVFGFSLGATSGDTSSVTITWNAGTRHRQYYVCGDGADPSVAPRIFTGFSG